MGKLELQTSGEQGSCEDKFLPQCLCVFVSFHLSSLTSTFCLHVVWTSQTPVAALDLLSLHKGSAPSVAMLIAQSFVVSTEQSELA